MKVSLLANKFCCLCCLNRVKICWAAAAAPPNGRNVVSRKMSTQVDQDESLELFVCGPKFSHFFAQCGNVDQVFFPIFNLSTRTRGICDQSRNMWEIAFRTYILSSQILGGGPSKNCTPHGTLPGKVS